MNNPNTHVAQPNRGRRIPTLRQFVALRWPALLGAAIVTAAVPVVTFAANPTQFPDGIQATASFFTAGNSGTQAVHVDGGMSVGGGGFFFENAPLSEAVNANSVNGIGVEARGATIGVDAVSAAGVGLRATGNTTAVDAFSDGGSDSIAVKATNFIGTAVMANSTVGTGVLATTTGAGTAVKAVSADGTAVKATSTNGIGVEARGATTASSFGVGVLGQGDEGVIARGTTLGVDATASGIAVAAVSSQGVGGDFSGKKAPIRLEPAATQGAPNAATGAHNRGELYVDNQGQLFLCIADGTPGTWKHVHLDN